MYTLARRSSRILAVFFVAAALFIAGCDSAVDDTIVLQPKTVTFDFPDFSADDVEGGVIELPSEAAQDLSDELRTDGFSREEVVSAELTEVEVRRIGPASQAKLLPFLNEIELSLDAPGQSLTTVGTSSEFDPTAGSTLLNPTDSDVGDFVQAESMDAELRLDVDTFEDDPPRLDARLTFVIEVEGV